MLPVMLCTATRVVLSLRSYKREKFTRRSIRSALYSLIVTVYMSLLCKITNTGER
jgi:hypothetical protein